MITSSKFFKKTFFTIDPSEVSSPSQSLKSQAYSPWEEDRQFYSLSPSRYHKQSINRSYHSSLGNHQASLQLEKYKEKMKKPTPTRELLLNEKLVVIEYEGEFENEKKTQKPKKKERNKEDRFELPEIKRSKNSLDNKSQFRPVGFNFIVKKASPSGLKKLLRGQDDLKFYDLEIYNRCLKAAHKSVFQTHK